MNAIFLADDVLIGRRPAPHEIDELEQLGVIAVVNIEPGGQNGHARRKIDDDELEAAAVHEHGMMYLNLPVASNWSAHDVDDFNAKMGFLPRPVFVHSDDGLLAGAFVLMHHAITKGWTGEQALAQARELTPLRENPRLREFVRSEIDARVRH